MEDYIKPPGGGLYQVSWWRTISSLPVEDYIKPPGGGLYQASWWRTTSSLLVEDYIKPPGGGLPQACLLLLYTKHRLMPFMVAIFYCPHVHRVRYKTNLHIYTMSCATVDYTHLGSATDQVLWSSISYTLLPSTDLSVLSFKQM